MIRRLSLMPLVALLTLLAAAQAPAPIRIELHPDRRFQTMDGFGVNFNGSYFRDSQKPMIDLLVKDLGATLFRLDPYGQTNWEAKNDDADPQHRNDEYYSDRYTTAYFEPSWRAARYLNSLGIRPFLTLSGITPDWMNDDTARPLSYKPCKSPEQIRAGGYTRPYHLNPTMYEEFAETAVSMLLHARFREHIDFEFFSPLNETDCFPVEGPRIDPDEMPKVLSTLVRLMRHEGLGDIKLVAADQSNENTDYVGPIVAEDDLMKNVVVLSLHTYGEGRGAFARHLQTIANSRHPGVRVWLTEYGDLGAPDRSPEAEWKLQSLKATRRALRSINEGARAALFWDAFDNHHEHDREMTYYGLMRNDNHHYSPKKRYYAAKQLYRFVPPGAQRIAADFPSDRAVVSGFHDGSTGRLIIVGVKESAGPVEVTLPQAENLRCELYLTTRDLDCARVGTVLVTRAALVRFDLPDEAVFTIVVSPEH